MDLILDTCGLLSLSGAVDKKISKRSKGMVSAATRLCISACSLFEISLKVNKGTLALDFESAMDYWDKAINKYEIETIPVSDYIFYDASMLPDIHNDPFDRIIISEAIANDLTVVTYDSVFLKYDINCIS